MWRVLLIAILISAGQSSGCVDHEPPEVSKAVFKATALKVHRFSVDKYETLSTDGFKKKVDYFTIIFDPSASMTEVYEPSYDCVACHIRYQDPAAAQDHAFIYGGKAFLDEDKLSFAQNCKYCHYNFHYSKFDYASKLAVAFNKVIPELDYVGILRTFGSPSYSDFSYGLKENDNTKLLAYDKKRFDIAIERIMDPDGVSPLFIALEDVKKDFAKKDGKIAVIIISDGQGMGRKEIFAAQDLKEKYGDNLCIYTILIGDDPDGSTVMERMARSGGGGRAVIGDVLLDKDDMEDFVRDIFLERVPAEPGQDQDQDGIADCRDQCPETEAGRVVDERGCWDLVLTADVLFDFDKYTLKPEGRTALIQVASLMKQHHSIAVHISGHTDNYGSMAYNIELSKRRAKAGFDFLVENRIEPARITMSWHAYTKPVATNKTSEGRALNRRLEFKFQRL